MPGRPKRRARLAREGKASTPARASDRPSARAPRKEASPGKCPSYTSALTILGRTICVDRGVGEWLRTGRGFSDGFTVGGSPKQNLEDLTIAVRRHIAGERKHAAHNARFGAESKFETRSLIEDDELGQGLWLWLNTHTRDSHYPTNCISVMIDHG